MIWRIYNVAMDKRHCRGATDIGGTSYPHILFRCSFWSGAMSKQPRIDSPVTVQAEIFPETLLEQVQFFCETFNIARSTVLEHLLTQAMAQYAPNNQAIHNKLRQFIDNDTNSRRDKWFHNQPWMED